MFRGKSVVTLVALVLCVVAIVSNETFGQSIGRGGSGGGIGGGGFGSGGFGGSGFSSGNSTGFTASSERFQVDSSNSSGFVGRDAEDAGRFFNALEGAQQNFLENLGLQPRQNRGKNQRNQQRPTVRITLRVAFPLPNIRPAAASALVQTQLVRSLKNRIDSPGVVLNDRTAVLTGQVATAHEKLVAEKLLLLEPGVSRVENRLVVASP